MQASSSQAILPAHFKKMLLTLLSAKLGKTMYLAKRLRTLSVKTQDYATCLVDFLSLWKSILNASQHSKRRNLQWLLVLGRL